MVCLNCLCLHSQPDVRPHCDAHNGTKGLIVAENKSKQNTGAKIKESSNKIAEKILVLHLRFMLPFCCVAY